MKKSSSIHSLNADRWQRALHKRVLWMLLNWAENSWFPNAASGALSVRPFVCDISSEDWNRLDIGSTPPRKLCDLFWMKLPWTLIRSELGQINALDTGCGSGKYGVKLQAFSNNNLASYVGLDINKRDSWNDLTKGHGNFQFYELNSANISEHIPEATNFFLTQSAIEHFDDDLSYFEQVRDFIMRTSRNIIQVHLFPSPACLWLFLAHGVRQYTPRTISKITRLFGEFSYWVLISLGGKECNSLHWKFITAPALGRKRNMPDTMGEEYDRRLLEAIKADMIKPQNSPSFYALVIHSNWREKIFLI